VHAGAVYELVSVYSLPDNAWTYELTGPRHAGVTSASVAAIIRDATPDDGPFTPMSAAHSYVLLDEGVVPWPILMRFVHHVEGTGDLRDDGDSSPVTGDLTLSLNRWQFAQRTFEVTSFHFGDHDCWCYELYEANPSTTDNNFLDARIPDLQPESGPFRPDTADTVTVGVHGSFALPWPVLRHFIHALQGSGDIVATDPTT
jgi:hypothetical protein